MRSRFPKVLTICACLLFFVWAVLPSQEGDPTFNPNVPRPAYLDAHPRVYFDTGHWNVHTPDGRYKPFADLLRHDGYEVLASKGALQGGKLRGFQVLVIANALGWRGSLQQFVNILHGDRHIHIAGPAFTAAECQAVRDWVRGGGSLLLISDHAPTGDAAAPLAEIFGVRMNNQWTEEPKSHDTVTDSWAFLVFSRDNGQLLDHPITRGRNEAERLKMVTTFTGQSLRVPPGAVSFLMLSAEARDYPFGKSDDNEFHSAANLAQGVALEFGAGRVVVLGEAAVLTSQLARAPGREFHFGLDWPGSDNRQLALNIMHWLSRALN